MATDELQIKISLAKDGLAKDAAAASQTIQSALAGTNVPIGVDKSKLSTEAQAVQAFLAGQFEEIPVGFKVDKNGKLRNDLGQFVKITEDAVKEFTDGVNDGLADGLSDGIQNAAKQVADLDRGLATIAATAGALGAGIGALFAAGVSAAAEYDRVLFAVEKQIESTSGSVGISASELQAFASDLGNATLTSEEAVLRASRSLLSFRSVTGDTFTRAITVSQDLAEVMGGDLESNIVQVGKALEDPVNGLSSLSRAGTQFTEAQKELIKSLVESGDQAGAQQVILEELERQYGGAGIAAAAGLTGSLDTLGEEMNDLTRTFGNFAQQGAKPVVDAAIVLVNAFNSLPAPIQTVLIASTAFVGVLATAVAALAAYNFANGQRVLTETLAAAAQIKSTIATAADIGVTQAATAAKTALALATGKATAAQIASAKALASGALTLGLFAGAVASVALVAETFIRVDAAASKTRDATKSVEEALRAVGEAGGSTGDEIGNGLSEAEQNLEQMREGLGGIQNALDRVRNVIPGIPTAAEAASNRSAIAFNELISSTDDVKLAAAEVAVSLEKGLSVDPEKIAATTAAIDAAVAALEAQQPVTEEDIARRDAQIAGLESYRERIAATTAGVTAMGDATGGLTDRIKEMDEALKSALGSIDLSSLQAKARILEQLARGEITQDQADTQLANLESQTLEARLQAQIDNLNKLRALRAEAADDSDQAIELDKQILAAETAVAQTRVSLAQGTVDAQTKAAEEATKAAEDAAKEQERIAKDAAKAEEERLAEEEKAREEAARAEEKRREDAIKAVEAQMNAEEALANVAIESAAIRISALDRVAEGLEQQSRALNAQAQLAESIGNLEAAIADEKANALQAILDDEEASDSQKRKAARDLLNLTKQQFETEKAQLEAKQALELQQFDLRQQQGALAEQRAIREQELALKRLDLQRLEIQNEIELARLRGDTNAIAIGEAQLGLLQEQTAAEREYLGALQQQAAISQQLGASERAGLLAAQEQADIALASRQRGEARAIDDQISGVDGSLDRAGDRLFSQSDRALQRELRQARNALPGLEGAGINPQALALAGQPTLPAGGLAGANFAQPIVAELQTLNGAINALAASPRQLTVQTPDPVADTSRILSDISRQQTAGVNP
jgi:hypothetical protein